MTERLFGIETEYAIVPTGPDQAGPRKDWLLARLADRAVSAFATLPDGSGHGLFFQNGARFYTDCGHHPEMTTPEVANPWDAVRYVLAGERILERLAAGGAPGAREALPALIFKSNIDYDSRATWGCHESIMHRADPALLPAQLIPHLVSRVVFSGAGGFDPLSPGIEFLLSPRAVYLQHDVSGESTSNRGIFHSKNETLCRPGYHRLHILCGESLCSQRAMWLRTATTVLVVAMIEGGVNAGAGVELSAPLDAIRTVASDPSCRARLPLASGSWATALEIQRRYLAKAEAHLGAAFMPPWAGPACIHWRAMLDRLEGGPLAVSTTLDWAIKRVLFEQFARRRGFGWSDLADWTNVLKAVAAPLAESSGQQRTTVIGALLNPTGAVRQVMAQARPLLARSGLSWNRLDEFARLRQDLFEADVRFGQLGGRGIFAVMDDEGALTHDVAGIDNIEHAIENPPAIGRARVRSQVVRRLAGDREAYACSWSHVVNRRNSTVLDLSDPFETAERWVPPQPGGVPWDGSGLNGNGAPSGFDLFALRAEAYNCYLQGRYQRAEELLRTLVQRGFDVADTQSHLARILIMLDRLPEARAVVDAAWDMREGAPADVIARLLWFQVYFALLDGADLTVPLGRLKAVLENTPAFNAWALAPLLHHVRPSLETEAYNLVSALFAAWSDRDRLFDLERCAAWRAAVPRAQC